VIAAVVVVDSVEMGIVAIVVSSVELVVAVVVGSVEVIMVAGVTYLVGAGVVADVMGTVVLVMVAVLGIPLSLHLIYIAEFGMAFLYSGSSWSSLYYGVSSLWVGLFRWLVKVSWLGKLVLVFWWVELDFFSLEYNEVSSNEL